MKYEYYESMFKSLNPVQQRHQQLKLWLFKKIGKMNGKNNSGAKTS